MPKIFIIEDDTKIRREAAVLLEKYGYTCDHSDDFQNIIELAIASSPDLIYLDINLPYFDGFFICKELRTKVSIPIIIVTSRDTDTDEIMGMNLGADDFIKKPYHPQILVARIAAVLKRSDTRNKPTIIQYKNLTLSPETSRIQYGDKETELTKNELRIMQKLFQNKGCIVSRDDLIFDIWQSNDFVDDNTLTVNINRIRKKLEELGLNDFLVTKRGQGYII